jgi:VWFA-related protein
MARRYSSKIVAVTLLALILILGLMAGAMAQDGGPVVTIIQVDSQAFPQMTAYIAVSDENGFPLTSLTEADLTILEEGLETPVTLTAVESVHSLDLSLALVLDVSMPDAPLAEVKEAALALLDALGPRDRVALLLLYDEFEVLHDFTNNTEELQAIIETLEGRGNYTTLYEVASEAAAITSKLSAGRKAVIILTNHKDNISSLSAEAAIEYARSVGVPLYPIGFGHHFRADPFQDMVKLTGGQSFCLPRPEEMRDTVQELEKCLRQGYRVTFQSGLKADNAEHDFSISATYKDRTGQAGGRFVALPSQVTVSLPGLAEEQTVAGVVNLTVQATAPTPIASVEYRLDDQTLAEVNTPPYSFEWDSTTLEPGTYRLTVYVVDQAGSEGQVEVNLNVVRPVVVTASASQTEVEVGDRVTIVAEVETLARVAQVEFLLDGEWVGSDDTLPYRFSFDNDAYPAGEHLITVRAEDSLGREAEASLTVQFLSPPALESLRLRLIERLSNWRRFLVIGGVITAALAIVAMSVIGLVIIAKTQKRRRRQIYQLGISNLGNVRSRYELRVEEPMGALEFQFTLNGVKLPQRPVPQATKTVAEAAIAPPASARSPASPAREGVGQRAGQAMRTGSAITKIVSSISAILPRSLGAPLQRAIRPVRKAQSTASRVTRLPTKVTRVMPAPSPARSTAQAAKPMPAPSPTRSTAPPTRAPARPQTVPVTLAPHLVGETWSQTPFAEPGKTLTIDLLIAPLNPYQTRNYSFKVISRSLDQEDPPLVVEEGSVQIVGISWFRRLLPYLIFTLSSTLVIATAVLVVGFLLANLGAWER